MTQTPAAVIPYIEHHTGPKRWVTVTMEPPPVPVGGVMTDMVQPNLFVDGRQFIVYWGQVTVETPADRPVHLAAGMQDGLRAASTLLAASSESVRLTYRVSVMGAASLEPDGEPPAP